MKGQGHRGQRSNLCFFSDCSGPSFLKGQGHRGQSQICVFLMFVPLLLPGP